VNIPIQNIYYLLCYAWDKLEEKEIVDVEPLDSTSLADLFARVLINGTNHLLKRGFDRATCRSMNGRVGCADGYASRKPFTQTQHGPAGFPVSSMN